MMMRIFWIIRRRIGMISPPPWECIQQSRGREGGLRQIKKTGENLQSMSKHWVPFKIHLDSPFSTGLNQSSENSLRCMNLKPKIPLLADDIGTRKSSNLETDVSQSETATFVILEDFIESMMFKILLCFNPFKFSWNTMQKIYSFKTNDTNDWNTVFIVCF